LHVCLACFTEYDTIFAQMFHSSLMKVNRPTPPCPIVGCQGEVVELDDLIAPAIIELNKKGYITRHCCAGHPGRRFANFYVSFEPDVRFPFSALQSLPAQIVLEPFEIQDEKTLRMYFVAETSFTVSAPFTDGEDPNLFPYIVQCNVDFYKWVLKLPQHEEYDEFEDTNDDSGRGELAYKMTELLIDAYGFSPEERVGDKQTSISIEDFAKLVESVPDPYFFYESLKRLSSLSKGALKYYINQIAVSLLED
jgi:hypothetical protein